MQFDSAPGYLPLTRFWSTIDSEPALEGDGWLHDPDPSPRFGIRSNPSARSFGDFDSEPALILLGEPGMGKSFALRASAAEAARMHQDDTVVLIDLRGVWSEQSFRRLLEQDSNLRSWYAGNEAAWLFIDSFDEAATRVRHLQLILVDVLSTWPVERLRLRIASRTADWPQSLTDSIRNAMGVRSATLLELLPLRRKDVGAFLDSPDAVEEFVAEIERVRAAPLASRPFTLKMLTTLFKRTGSLPDRAVDTYQQALTVMCEEWDDRRRDSVYGTHSASDVLRAAEALAALTMFSSKLVFWLGSSAEFDESMASATDWLALGDSPETALQPALFQAALQSALFSGRGRSALGWAHARFSEYLAACWVMDAQLRPDQIRSLFCAHDQALHEHLHQVAAWLVAMQPNDFGWMVTHDPSAFLQNVDIPSDDLKHATVAGLLQRTASGDFVHELRRSYQNLRHADLRDQLAAALSDPDPFVARLAIEIARDTQEDEVVPDLARVTLDEARPIGLRTSAAMAIYNSEPGQPTDLVADLARRISVDPGLDEAELRAAALFASWPHAVTTEEILSTFTAQHPSNYFGIAALFIDALADGLTDADIDAVRGWLQRSRSQLGDERLRRLTLASVRLCMRHLDDDSVLETLTGIVIAKYSAYDTDFSDAIGSCVAENPEGRLTLANSVLRQTGADEAFFIVSPWSKPESALLSADDFAWLLGNFDSFPDESHQTVSTVLSELFRPERFEHSEKLLSIPTDHPLRRLMPSLFENVRLDSPLATMAQQRARKARERKHAEEEELCKREWVNNRINAIVKEGTPTKPAQFPEASTLTFYPLTSLRWSPGTSADMTKSERWPTLSSDIQEGLADLALVFLTSQEVAFKAPAPGELFSAEEVAAYRALTLLLKKNSEGLDNLPPSVWRRCARVLVEWPAHEHASYIDNEHLIQIAVRADRGSFEDALIHLLTFLTPESFLPRKAEQLDAVWSQPFSERLFARMGDMTRPAQAEALEAFGRNDPEMVRGYLLDRLSTANISAAPESAVDAASRLLGFDPIAAWERLRDVGQTSPHILEDACLDRARQSGHTSVKLAAHQSAELFIWLETRFPRVDDPRETEVHFVTPRESIGHWRDALLEHLANAGTQAAVDALLRIEQAFPAYSWLRRYVLDARRGASLRLWQPLAPRELAALSARGAHLVRNTGDLRRATVAALNDIQRRLQADTPEVSLLWNSEPRTPKSEDDISDYLRSRLKDYFRGHGAIVNREVQVRRTGSSGMGERSDLRLDATTKKGDLISLIIEVKGVWNRDLLGALKSQLVDRYMADLGVTDGIYLILTASTDVWDRQDKRRNAAERGRKASVHQHLDALAADLAMRGIHVDVVDLDISLSRPTPSY